LDGGYSVSGRPATLPTGPVMMMVAPVLMRVSVIAPRGVVMGAPVPMRVLVGAPMVIAPMGAVVPSPHHDDRRGSDHDGRWDAEADVNIDAGLGGLGLREQCESQEWDHTTQVYDTFDTFHSHILVVKS